MRIFILIIIILYHLFMLIRFGREYAKRFNVKYSTARAFRHWILVLWSIYIIISSLFYYNIL